MAFVQEDHLFAGAEVLDWVEFVKSSLDRAQKETDRLRCHYGGQLQLSNPLVQLRKIVVEVSYIEKKVYDIKICIRSFVRPGQSRQRIIQNFSDILANVDSLFEEVENINNGPEGNSQQTFDNIDSSINSINQYIDIIEEWANP
jgi:hypothetical protein